MDRRISKTKYALKQALTELMATTNYHEISITDLCDKANVNRGTFYLHYKNVEEFVKQLEDDVTTRLGKIMYKHYPIKNNQYFELCNDVAQIIKDDKDFLKVLLGRNGDYNFVKRITRYAKEIVLNLNKFKIDEEDGQYLSFYLTFLVEGGIGVLAEWVTNGCKDDIIAIIKRFEKLLYKVIS